MGIFDKKTQTASMKNETTWVSTWGIALEETKPTGARDMHLAGFGDSLKVIMTTSRCQYGLEATPKGALVIQALVADDSKKAMIKTPPVELAGEFAGKLNESYTDIQRNWMKSGKKVGDNAIMPTYYAKVIDQEIAPAKKRKVA